MQGNAGSKRHRHGCSIRIAVLEDPKLWLGCFDDHTNFDRLINLAHPLQSNEAFMPGKLVPLDLVRHWISDPVSTAGWGLGNMGLRVFEQGTNVHYIVYMYTHYRQVEIQVEIGLYRDNLVSHMLQVKHRRMLVTH